MKIILADVNLNAIEVVAPAVPEMEILMSYYFLETRYYTRLPLLNKKFYFDSGVVQLRKKSQIQKKKEVSNDILIKLYKDTDFVKYIFNLDIGEIKDQLHSYDVMRKAGVPTIPIWHGHMPFDIIDRFVETTDYIAISMFKLAGKNKETNVYAYLDKFWTYIMNRNLFPLKVHILGVERPNILLKYPFYSCDASSYTASMRFGAIHKFTLQGFKNLKLRYNKKTVKDMARGLGVHAINSKEKRYKIQAVNSAKERLKAQRLITKVWENRGVVWKD